jgi:hypothetical protein
MYEISHYDFAIDQHGKQWRIVFPVARHGDGRTQRLAPVRRAWSDQEAAELVLAFNLKLQASKGA